MAEILHEIRSALANGSKSSLPTTCLNLLRLATKNELIQNITASYKQVVMIFYLQYYLQGESANPVQRVKCTFENESVPVLFVKLVM